MVKTRAKRLRSPSPPAAGPSRADGRHGGADLAAKSLAPEADSTPGFPPSPPASSPRSVLDPLFGVVPTSPPSSRPPSPMDIDATESVEQQTQTALHDGGDQPIAAPAQEASRAPSPDLSVSVHQIGIKLDPAPAPKYETPVQKAERECREAQADLKLAYSRVQQYSQHGVDEFSQLEKNVRERASAFLAARQAYRRLQRSS